MPNYEIDIAHYEWVASVDPNKQEARDFHDYQHAAKLILKLYDQVIKEEEYRKEIVGMIREMRPLDDIDQHASRGDVKSEEGIYNIIIERASIPIQFTSNSAAENLRMACREVAREIDGYKKLRQITDVRVNNSDITGFGGKVVVKTLLGPNDASIYFKRYFRAGAE
jgi:hypothetical protein